MASARKKSGCMSLHEPLIDAFKRLHEPLIDAFWKIVQG
ncbi:hypothetical protein LTSEMON_5488 [Salmonella enterica subsp. enterica serovar Montevideo str. S5-403]|uniref:Uncharacterized protein n=1 Tax=Salmonella enterica subsp. enterica serovar Montevideo str. S5-403 TaxID=913242 RepID=G5QAI1_SALMO|nr:hypothetical protein LTSEMON_5488 [Salmonella enterica subsp. enterica serovar Montevideo str. S5-403]